MASINSEQQSFETKPDSTQNDSLLSEEEISKADLSGYFKNTDFVSISYQDKGGIPHGKTGLTLDQLGKERELLNLQFKGMPECGPNFFHYKVTVSPEWEYRVQDQYGERYGPFKTEKEAEVLRDELQNAAIDDRKPDDAKKIRVLKEGKVAGSSGSK